MHRRATSRPILRGASFAAVAAGLILALVVPASAQFWQNWGSQPQRPAQRAPQQQQQQHYNPFGGGWWGSGSQQQQPEGRRTPQRDSPVDYSRAPSPQHQAHSGPTTTSIAVVGDGMADWLAYGLEDAFAEKPEVEVLRKHRTTSGLVRYDPRRDIEWAQVIKDVVAADKPKFMVMMVGVNDRQPIRERVTPGRPGAPSKPNMPDLGAPMPTDAELHAQQSADEQNAEMGGRDAPEPASPPDDENRGTGNQAGVYEFHTEKWELGYVRRIDATIAAMKSAGVPVFWVGLPSQRNSRASSDSAYLNELFRQRADKAGIIFVDVWDGFVDEAGRFTSQGPDFEGQIRRLRSGDGIYFTKAGARKLAHYVEREIQRILTNRAVPLPLPEAEPLPSLVTSVPVVPGSGSPAGAAPGAAAATRPGAVGPRPLAGPVVPLTVSTGGELLGSGTAPRLAAVTDPIAMRVLTNGEPMAAPGGRADDFSWPRGSNPLLAITALPPDTPPAARRQQPVPKGPRPAAATNASQSKGDARPSAQQPAPKTEAKQPRRQRPPGPSAEIAPRSGVFNR
jgi:hypothetical protein